MADFFPDVDYFDLLPDPILLLILNKILDAKSLCQCLLVSKRFASLIPEVDSVYIELNPPKSKIPIKDSLKLRSGSSSSSRNFVKNFVSKLIGKLQLLRQQVAGKKLNTLENSDSGSTVDVHQWVGAVLKNFTEIKSLKLELPCHGGEIGVNRSIPLLKWEAGFGKGLEKCIILGATSISQRREKVTGATIEDDDTESDQNSNNEPLFSDDELKLRIIWIISCLIASSARHNLMKKMVNECPKLSNVTISDAGKQGKLCMNGGQISDLRESLKSTNDFGSESESESPAMEGGSTMGYVGNLVMKLWYVKELALPCCGKVMEGATLVVIRPDCKVGGGGGGGEEREREGDGVSLKGAFEGGEEVFEEAARELLKMKEKRVYRLEMNSF